MDYPVNEPGNDIYLNLELGTSERKANVMKALDKKLWRELWRMKGQVFAISMVVMSGVATFIMFISTMHSLDFTRNKFYRDYNFADVFVNLKRAPESLKDKIKNIHGVKQLETRVSAQAKLDIKGFSE